MTGRTEPSSFPGGIAVTAEETNTSVTVFGDPVDGQVPAWSTERNRFEWVDPGASSLRVVDFGSDADTARPDGVAAVYWIGSVQPNNAEASDLWTDTS